MRLRRSERLPDMCTVSRGDYPDQTTVATGVSCKVRQSRSARRESELAGGSKVTLPSYEVEVPYTTDVVRGDVIVVTSLRDPGLSGRFMTVIAVTHDSYLTSRFAHCVDQQE